MNTQNPFLAFFQELFQRFATKSPMFFRVWQWVLGAVTAVTGFPSFLKMVGLSLPPAATFFESKIVGACTASAFIMSLLPTSSTPTKIDSNGSLLKKTPDALPFTQLQDAKQFPGLLKVVVLLILSMSCMYGHSQTIFQPIPRPVFHLPPPPIYVPGQMHAMATAPAPAPIILDSSYSGFRLSGPIVLYALPNSAVFTGIGITYKRAVYSSTTLKWSTKWAVTLAGFEGGQFAPSSIQAVTALGLTVSYPIGVFLVTAGVLYNFMGKQVQAGIGPMVPLDN